ncbi:hypothetical protein SDC9_199235 [bioreactor metagenome]|uniref:Uncharacterized protein n=1 Tax=bioreactor metagenome TaxID=1076179 RepID=A0A645IJY4_9ZZZZ
MDFDYGSVIGIDRTIRHLQQLIGKTGCIGDIDLLPFQRKHQIALQGFVGLPLRSR